MGDEKGINIDARLRSSMPSGTPALSTGQTLHHIRSICAVSCSVYSLGEQLIELPSQLHIAVLAIRRVAAVTESENCDSVSQRICVTEKRK